MIRSLLLVGLFLGAIEAQDFKDPAPVLPATATAALAESLKAAAAHSKHVWRDTAPVNDDRTVNAYVEIGRGDRRKWELDISANIRAIDRMIPIDIGGYPVNYGFVPQTISYDGDPFDALVLGPEIPGGQLVRGVIVGVMFMEDEKGLESKVDSKVVLSPTGRDGRPLHQLTDTVRREIANYFNEYKKHEPGAFSNVPGWGSAAEGLAYVTTTHAFFKDCQGRAATPCALDR